MLESRLFVIVLENIRHWIGRGTKNTSVKKKKEYAEQKVKAKGSDGKDTTCSTTKLGWQALT